MTEELGPLAGLQGTWEGEKGTDTAVRCQNLVRGRFRLTCSPDGPWLRRLSPGVAMVKAAHTEQGDDLSTRRRSVLDPPARWRVLQGGMDAVRVVVGDVGAE